MTTVIIHPEPPQDMKSLIQELYGLTDRRLDVEYVMWPEPGVRVPEELFDKFVSARIKASKVEGSAGQEPSGDAGGEEVTELPKRKPGRPKKIQEGQ